jgi:nucleoside-diphosphate-sugar epimerase
LTGFQAGADTVGGKPGKPAGAVSCPAGQQTARATQRRGAAMVIVGRGFIAKNLEPIAAEHDDVLLLAAGVSRTTATSDAEFVRERLLVEDSVQRCMREGRRLVFLSTASSGVYGGAHCTGRENEAVTPSSPYAAHKLALERILQECGVEYLVLRLSHLVGQHQQPWQLLPSLVSQVMAGRVMVRRGAQRDLLEVSDMVRITGRLLQDGVSREIVNVASGVPVPIELVVEYVEKRLGRTAVHDVVDVDERSVIDIGKLRRLVPEVAAMGFGATYYQQVLDTYLGVPSGAR